MIKAINNKNASGSISNLRNRSSVRTETRTSSDDRKKSNWSGTEPDSVCSPSQSGVATKVFSGKDHFQIRNYTRRDVLYRRKKAVSLLVNSLTFCLCLFCLSVFLSFCLSVFLSFCLSVFLSFCLSVFLSFCLSVFLSFCLSVFMSLCLSVFLSFCLYVFLSFCLSVFSGNKNRFQIHSFTL